MQHLSSKEVWIWYGLYFLKKAAEEWEKIKCIPLSPCSAPWGSKLPTLGLWELCFPQWSDHRAERAVQHPWVISCSSNSVGQTCRSFYTKKQVLRVGADLILQVHLFCLFLLLCSVINFCSIWMIHIVPWWNDTTLCFYAFIIKHYSWKNHQVCLGSSVQFIFPKLYFE